MLISILFCENASKQQRIQWGSEGVATPHFCRKISFTVNLIFFTKNRLFGKFFLSQKIKLNSIFSLLLKYEIRATVSSEYTKKDFICNVVKNTGTLICLFDFMQLLVFSPQPTNLAKGYLYPPFHPSSRLSVC